MFIEISNMGVVALFFVFLFTYIAKLVGTDMLERPRRIVHLVIYAVVLLVLLVIAALDTPLHIMV